MSESDQTVDKLVDVTAAMNVPRSLRHAAVIWMDRALDAEEKVSALTADLEQARAENDHERQMNASLFVDLEQARADVEDLNQQCDSMARSRLRAEQERDAARRDIGRLETENQELRERLQHADR